MHLKIGFASMMMDDGDAFGTKSHYQSDILTSSCLLSVHLFVLVFRYSLKMNDANVQSGV